MWVSAGAFGFIRYLRYTWILLSHGANKFMREIGVKWVYDVSVGEISASQHIVYHNTTGNDSPTGCDDGVMG